MAPESENNGTTGAAAVQSLPAEGAAGSPAALTRGEEGTAKPAVERDTRLDRLPMQLDVMVKVRSFRVRDLLALDQGAVLETIHEHTQDVPVRSGGALLVWGEFEMVEQRLAVRITRLA